MEAKPKIEVIQVRQEEENMQSVRKTMSRQGAAEWINESVSDGLIAIMHLKGLPDARVYLYVLTGNGKSLIALNGDPVHDAGAAIQLLGFSLGFGQQVSPNNNDSLHQKPENASRGNGSDGTATSNNHKTTGEVMTEAQRRYLFRLLAEKKNLKGKAAENYLKERFEVGSLRDIEKFHASKLIERLISE